MLYVQDCIDADKFVGSLRLIPASKRTITEKLFPMLFAKDKHKWMYDFKTLSRILFAVEFTQIIQVQYKHGQVPDIEKLDNREKGRAYL